MPRKQSSLKSRTTLTLPSESLRQARKIADQRHVNLSTVISEVVSAGLELENAKLRRNQILDSYRKAFAGFSPDELAILDAVILEPPRANRATRKDSPRERSG